MWVNLHHSGNWRMCVLGLPTSKGWCFSLYNVVSPWHFQFPWQFLTPDKENEDPRVWVKLASRSYSQQRVRCHWRPQSTWAALVTATQPCWLADSTAWHRVLRAAHGDGQNHSSSAGGARPRTSEKQPGGKKPMLTPSGLRLDTSASRT